MSEFSDNVSPLKEETGAGAGGQAAGAPTSGDNGHGEAAGIPTPTPQTVPAGDGKGPSVDLETTLETLVEATDDIDAAAVVGMDGGVMASVLPAGLKAGRMGAMSAALLSLGEKTAKELGRGKLAQVFIEGTDGYVFLLAAGNGAVLCALVKRACKLGPVLGEIREAAKSVATMLSAD
jgi:hypothetical protein